MESNRKFEITREELFTIIDSLEETINSNKKILEWDIETNAYDTEYRKEVIAEYNSLRVKLEKHASFMCPEDVVMCERTYID